MKQFFLSISSWKKQHKKLYQSNLNNVKIILIETIFCWDAFQSGKTVSYHLLVPVQITRFIPFLCPKIYWHLHKRICQNSFQLFASITFKILRAASSLTVKQDKIWEFIARKITLLLIWIWIWFCGQTVRASVTRLGDFWMLLLTNWGTWFFQIFNDFICYFEKL